MTKRPLSPVFVRPLRLMCCGLWLGACATGTETGNPVQDEPPDPPPPYESPSRFNPNDPQVPGCPGIPDDTSPQRGPYWTASDTHVIGVDQQRGLVTLDAKNALNLRFAGSTVLHGYARAVAQAGNHIAVVLDERAPLPTDTIPEAEALELQLTLAQFDVTDPSAPERVDTIELAGEFFGLRERDGVVWLVTTQPQEQAQSCQLPWARCSFASRVEMQVAGYRLGEDGFEPVADAQLSMSQRGWLGKDGFVAVTPDYLRADEQPATAFWARIDGEELVTGEMTLDGPPAYGAPVELVGERLFYFTEEEQGMAMTLHIVDVGSGDAEEIATVSDLPSPVTVGAFFSENWAVIGSENFAQAGVVVQLEQDGPASVTPLPGDYSMAFPLQPSADSANATDTVALPRLLTWGDVDGSGMLTMGLVDSATGLAAGEVTASTTSTIAAALVRENEPFYPPQMVQVGSKIATAFRSYGEQYDWLSAVGVVELSEAGLGVSVHEAEFVDDDIVAVGTSFFAPSTLGIAVVDDEGSDAWFDFDSRSVEDVMPVEDGSATLERTWNGSTQVVVRDEEEQELGAVEVPGGARQLVPIGSYIGVLIEPQGNECEQMGGSNCDERSVWIVDPDGPVGLAQVPLPALVTDPDSGDPGDVQLLELESGAWVFALQQTETCLYIADCEARGIDYRSLSEANVIAGQPSPEPCPDDVDCPEPEPPPPPPEVYGKRTRLALHRLDAEHPSNPRWVDVGSSELELQDSWFAPVRAAGESVLVTRLELQRERGQPSSNAPARFMLEVFNPSPTARDGAPAEPAAINVPGYVIAFVAAADTNGRASETADPSSGTIFTVEPGVDTDVAATLHRLHLAESGAHIEASLPLAGRYGDLVVLNERAYYARQAVDGCSSGELQIIAVDGEMEIVDRIPLPGIEWSIADLRSGALLLNGSGYVLFDVSDPTPALVGYFSDRPSSETARTFAGEVWAP